MNIKVTDMSTDKKDKNRIPNPVATFSQAFRDYRMCYDSQSNLIRTITYHTMFVIFNELLFIAEIMSEIEKQGFEKPSPIQVSKYVKYCSKCEIS